MASTTNFQWPLIAEWDIDWFTEIDTLFNAIDAEVYNVFCMTSANSASIYENAAAIIACSTSIIKVHGNLLGLDVDDHSQYFMVQGRTDENLSVSGDLIIGGSIYTAGNMNIDGYLALGDAAISNTKYVNMEFSQDAVVNTYGMYMKYKPLGGQGSRTHYGAYFWVAASTTSLLGIRGIVGRAGAEGGYVANDCVGVHAELWNNGSVLLGRGLYAQVGGGGYAQIARGVDILVTDGDSRYGLYIGNVASGASVNYSIYTGTGSVRFGGTVSTVGRLNVGGFGYFQEDIFVQSADQDSDATIYFSASTQSMKYDYDNSRFEFSTAIYTANDIVGGTVYGTTGIKSWADLYVNSNYVSGDEDAVIYFNATSQNLAWDYGDTRFEFSSNLYVDGYLYSTDYIYSTSLLGTAGDILRMATSKTPSGSGDTGTQGDICWDSGYLYVCVDTDTWRRVAHASW